ncbi:TlpA disulfide reductase family protein [Desulfogranum mediterraneum]|uniref:TlpA disulfide reductase family protein n=1 Tax=Desulfogranum mediterraneum TaxID=160661 RepID=UPI00041626AA|nr:TlpA disulfide reductase family protein [Desulfogranum mediterraneum]
MKRLRCLLLTILLLATGSSAAVPLFAADAMPPFSLPSALDGRLLNSELYAGKVLLVNFFATWCAPCRREIPILKRLHQQYEEQGFSVIGLSLDEGGPQLVAKLIAAEQLSYPVVMADRATARAFGGVVGFPTSFLVNRAGHIIRRYSEFAPRSLLEKDIKSAL